MQTNSWIPRPPDFPARRVKALLLLLFCFLLPGLSGHAETMTPSAFPSLFAATRIDGSLKFCGEAVRLDKNNARERMEKEMLLTLWDRPQVVLWLKRSRRYFPVIEDKLKSNGMPEDLKYISLVESALRPHVGSPRGAVGFWQFTPSTGKKYGLQIDSEKDERRNIHKSTDAAIAYLKELYETFGSWTLAAAAYNMGEHGLQAEIMVQKSENFYDLYLPLETQRYVFRIVSAKCIMTRPETYGFHFSRKDLYPPSASESAAVECFDETPIALVARAAGTQFKVIKDLNPELRGHYLYAGRHLINLPEGSAKGFQSRLSALVKQWEKKQKDRVYVVKKGDNLSSIAERFNVPLPVLLIWNNLNFSDPIHPGDRLVIHSHEKRSEQDTD